MDMYFLVVTFAIYNISVITLARSCFKSVDLKKTLREKREINHTVPAQNILPSSPDVADANRDKDQGDSYSRITGAVGAVVIASFIWGLGNAIIYNAFESPGNIPGILNGVGTFILSASALFAPYAFNQLSNVFPTSIPAKNP